MKKLIMLLAAACALCGFNSCDKAESSFYTVGVFPSNAITLIYADEESDSVVVRSSLDWTLKSNDSWISLSPTGLKEISSNKLQRTCQVYFDTNNTGKGRMGYLELNNGRDVIRHHFYQAPWIEVTCPVALYPEKTEEDPFGGALFLIRTDKKVNTNNIEFKLRDARASISATQDWIHTDLNSVTKGDCIVKVTTSANNTGDKREGDIIIETTLGIKTYIHVFQEK